MIRDLFRGRSRFSDLASTEGIPTNILADRLKRLEDAGMISSKPYQQNPTRYAYVLTAKGRDLKPVLAALGGWALRHVKNLEPDPALLKALRAG